MGASYRFGAALNLQFIKNFAVMPFDRVQCQEKPLADLTVDQPIGDEPIPFWRKHFATWQPSAAPVKQTGSRNTAGNAEALRRFVARHAEDV